MSRGKPNKRYTPEFKKLVVETMMKEKLIPSYSNSLSNEMSRLVAGCHFSEANIL